MTPDATNPAQPTSSRLSRDELLVSLRKLVTDPYHARIIDAYRRTGTVQGAENELNRILQEVLDEA